MKKQALYVSLQNCDILYYIKRYQPNNAKYALKASDEYIECYFVYFVLFY